MKPATQRITPRFDHQYTRKDGLKLVQFELRNYTPSPIRIRLLDNTGNLLHAKEGTIKNGKVIGNGALYEYLNKVSNKCRLTLDFLKYSRLDINKKNIENYLYFQYSDVMRYFENVTDTEKIGTFLESLHTNKAQLPNSSNEQEKIISGLGITKPSGILEAIQYYNFPNIKNNSLVLCLKNYYEHQNIPDINLSIFNLEMFDALIRWTIQNPTYITINKPEKKHKYYNLESIVLIVKNIKILWNELRKEGYELNKDIHKFELIKGNRKNAHVKFLWNDKQNVFSITMKELETLENAVISNKTLEIARDLFLLQTYLGGLRVSELKSITKDSFKRINGKIHIVLHTQKTSKILDTPLSDKAAKICEKYKYQIEDVVFSYEGDYNDYLKKIAKDFGIKRQIMQFNPIAKNDKPEMYIKPLHELFCNKLARKACVSILFSLGYNIEQICSITKHSKEAVQYYLSLLVNEKEEIINCL